MVIHLGFVTASHQARGLASERGVGRGNVHQSATPQRPRPQFPVPDVDQHGAGVERGVRGGGTAVYFSFVLVSHPFWVLVLKKKAPNKTKKKGNSF